MTPRRRAWSTAAAVILLVPVPSALADNPVDFAAPTAHGAVGLSERLAYEMTGACEKADVAVVLVTDTRAVEGAAVRGCEGRVTVPAEAALAGRGVTEEDVRAVVLRARVGKRVVTEQPLRLERLQAEHAEVVAGDVMPIELDGRRALTIAGASGTLSLGTVDLTRLHSLSFRYATGVDASMVCSPIGYDGPHCVAATVTVTDGVGGPVVASGELLHGRAGWERVVTPLLVDLDRSAQLVARFDAVPPAHCGPLTTPSSPMGRCSDGAGLLHVDAIDLNGRGAAEPYVPPADPKGTVPLFDGTSLDGWKESGATQGAFTVDDGELVVRGGFGLIYHEQVFRDYELRLDFKVDSPLANSGVHVRFAEPPVSDPMQANATGYEIQVQDYGFNYPGSRDHSQTGSVYQEKASERIATNDVGEWNSYAIRVVGQTYTVSLNGRVVTRFTGSRLLDGHIGLQSHDPSGEIRYRDLRVLPLKK